MNLRVGYLYGGVTYLIWGLFPLYFHQIHTGPMETIAHRIIWSGLFLVLIVSALRRWRKLRALPWSLAMVARIGACAALVGANWTLFIYGIAVGRVVEVAIGYFICPLLIAGLGMAFFGERLRFWQWPAIALCVAAVAVLTINYGQVPWLALGVGGTFAGYGMLKKQLGLNPLDGLTVETGLLVLPALIYLWWLGGTNVFGASTGQSALLVGAGIFTAGTLMSYAATANRLPMVALGLMQYITPSLQFLCGVFIFHEAMPPVRWIGMALIWTALVIFAIDALRARQPAQDRLVDPEPAVANAA